jgi:chemotaxis protein MotB
LESYFLAGDILNQVVTFTKIYLMNSHIMKNIQIVIFAFSIILMLPCCVSKKKFLEIELERNHFKDKFDELREVKADKAVVESKLKITESTLRQTTRELEQLTVQTDQLQRDNDRILKRYNEIIEDNKDVLSTASVEKLTLEEKLSQQEKELDAKQRELEGLEYVLGQREGSLEDLRTDLQSREQRVNELETLLNSKDAQMSQLRQSIQQTLRGFSAADLSVTERNGNIYVSLSSDLLFKSGSDQIDWKGKNALKQVAEVMNTNDDIDINVEGHTDNVGNPNLNWDLSVKRATAVVKVLTTNGVDPSRIIASGRGLYAPILPNDTEVNRSKNRRTDIILSPKLEKLYEIINN